MDVDNSDEITGTQIYISRPGYLTWPQPRFLKYVSEDGLEEHWTLINPPGTERSSPPMFEVLLKEAGEMSNPPLFPGLKLQKVGTPRACPPWLRPGMCVWCGEFH